MDEPLPSIKSNTLAPRLIRPKKKRWIAGLRWQQAYAVYLTTPEWRFKRQRVLERAHGVCEGCGDRKAVEVHHLRYPQGCLAGSAEWQAREKLFDLAAICDQCHRDIHSYEPPDFPLRSR
jgi:5-methylcytosine-specific restriction endonuclease McrA